MSEPRENEIVIEVDNEETIIRDAIYDGRGNVIEERYPQIVGNRNYYFFPTEKLLRSGFKPMRAGSPPGPLLGIEYIPGQRVHLDMAAREGRISDALGDKVNQPLLSRLASAWRQMEIVGQIGQPVKDEVVGLRNDEAFYTWMYWMRRMVDGTPTERFVRPIQNVNKLPSMDEIVKSGFVLLPIYEPDVKGVIKGRHLTPELAGMAQAKTEQVYHYGQEA